MSATHPQFTGSVPQNYDRYLVPVLFRPYAESLASRVAALKPTSVLELACGTGAVTVALAEALPPGTRIVATDFSESMLEFAKHKLSGLEGVEWQVADACALPFEDSSFDVIACQFGAMFFPDKAAAMAEAYRALAPGGHLLFSTWGHFTENPLFHIAEKTLSAKMPEEETPIIPTPFLMSDPEAVRELVCGAGFATVEVTEETFPVGPVDPASIAAGFAFGTPLSVYLMSKGHDLHEIRAVLTEAYRGELGDPCHGSMQAIVCHATPC